MRPGDIVTEFNGTTITHWEDLPWLASTGTTQKKTPIELLRRGKSKRLAVRLTHYPDNTPASASARRKGDDAREAPVEAIGLTLGALSKAQRSALRLGKRGGVAITAVKRGTNAFRAGLRAGDIVLQLNYEDVGTSAADVAKTLSRTSKGEIISVLIRREQRRIFMAFPR